MRKLRMWVFAFVAVAALGLPAGLAHGSPPPPGDGPDKSGTIHLWGSKSGWAKVHLKSSVRVSERTIISGGGRAIGFVLLPNPLPEDWTSGPFLYGASFGRCTVRGCEPSGPRGGFQFGSYRLPAGHYRIYLLADGAPARVQIPLSGLRENLRLRVHHSALVDIRSLASRVSEVPGRIVYSAGSHSKVNGRGLALQGMWIDSSASAVGAWGNCIYKRGQNVPDPTIAYLPASIQACRAPDPEDALGTIGQINGLHVTTSGAYGYLPKAIGSWYSSASMVQSSGAVAVWLRF